MQESGDNPGQGGQETFGSVPSQGGGSETFGTVPGQGGNETFGSTAHPQPPSHPQAPSAPAPAPAGGNRNVGLLVGGVIAVLIVIAAIVGFAVK